MDYVIQKLHDNLLGVSRTMNSNEATVRGHLRSRFESTFEERVHRALDVHPQVIIPHHHFAWASTECVYLYRDSYFMATAMATQALNEALIRFIADRNGIPSNQDRYVLVDTFVTQNIVSVACADAMRRILKSFRNDFHHLNPTISKVPVQEIAKRNIEDIVIIEKEIFEHTYENEKISPKQEKYWDVRPDGTVLVLLRSG